MLKTEITLFYKLLKEAKSAFTDRNMIARIERVTRK